MEWQTWVAIGIVAFAAIWAVWKIASPIINEFRRKKTPDAGCCGCGVKSAADVCGAVKKNLE